MIELFRGLNGYRRRARDMINAAASYGIEASTTYEDLFDDLSVDALSREEIFLAETADAVAASLVSKVVTMAQQEIARTGIERCSAQGVANAMTKLRQRVPVDGAASIADILNAGWQAQLDAGFWDQRHEDSKRAGDTGLKELLLKSIEVFEIEKLTGDASAS